MDPTMYKAAMEGNIEYLIAHLQRDEENGYQVTPKGNTVLHIAAFYGHSRFVEEVLKLIPGLLCHQNKKNETALHIAANKGHTLVVIILLSKAREDKETLLMTTTDENGDTALHNAVRSGHLDIVRLLVKGDPEFEFPANKAGETPLYLAAESGFVNILHEIVESCKKPTYAARPSNRTPLHAAVIQEHIGTPYKHFM